MGNTVKGTGGIGRDNRTDDSTETDSVRYQDHLERNRSIKVDIRQPSDNEAASNNKQRRSNNVNNEQKETSESNRDIIERNGNYKEIYDRDNIASDHESNLENITKQQQSSRHSSATDQIKRKVYVKTPVVSKSRMDTSDNIGEIAHPGQLPKRPYSTTVRSTPTTPKLMTKRSCSEPVSKTYISKQPELSPIHDDYLEDNEDSLMDTELDMDKDESELDFGSSVRSGSLDSRLFDSQITIETHSSIEQQGTASRTYSENRYKLKRGLLDYYMSTGFTIPEFPLLPYHDDQTKSGRYWPPWMTVTERFNEKDDDSSVLISNLETLYMNNYEYDKNVNQFNQIFNHEGRDMKNIYIVGDSGTGKTAFCKHLIHKWCMQHQSKENATDSIKPTLSRLEDASFSVGRNASINHAKYVGSKKPNHFGEALISETDSYSDDVFSDTNELDKYEFLFYIPLFYETNHDAISEIIDTQFRNILNNMKPEIGDQNRSAVKRTGSSFLSELFEKESEKCLIVIDGFDQWRHSNKKGSKPFLPIKDPSKNYTVIITSTSKQLEAVEIETTRDDFEVTLYGIDENTSNTLIDDLIDRLNKTVGRRKRPADFIEEMDSWKHTYFKRLPFVLQSILYLWYHAGSIGNTVCDIFSRILELQFKALSDQLNLEANKLHGRKSNTTKPKTPFRTADKVVKLPRYFISLTNCQKFKELITILGKIALSTRNKYLSSFDSSTLEVYGFTQVETSYLIKVGILTQKKVPGFSPLRHNRNVFFCDERMQEFLASTYLVQLFQNTAYENIGRVHIHTDKIISVLKSEFDIFFSLDKVFQFSNMINLICGLYPPTTEEITHIIYDVIKKDSRVLEFRKSLITESQDDVDVEIQGLISSCARESLSVNTKKMHLYIGDISYRYFEPVYVKYIPTSHIKSLLIDADIEPVVPSNVSKFIQETRISNGLQKLMVKDENSHLSLEDIDSLHILTQRCLQTLNVLSYVLNYNTRIIYLKITQDLHNFLPKMSNLIELELKGIKLSHTEFSTLAFTLSKLTGLKRLHLFDLACEMPRCDCEEHKMDFLSCNKLEHIEVDGRQLPIIGVNKEKLVNCNLGNLPQGAEIQIFSSLRHAKCLKHFTQKVRRRPPFISQTLIKTVNTWYNLETLYLNGINFGEYELIFDAQMKHLTNIRLVDTSMGRTGWCLFIDSLQELPQVITIVTRDILVSLLEEDITRDPVRRPVDAETRAVMLARETELEQAFNYVRKQTDTFKVVFHMDNMFDFEKTIITK